MSSVDLGIDGLSDFTEIGSGGFSTVYLAYERGFGRHVAVKVLQSIDADGRRRFDRELALMGQLNDHPNVVTPYRFGYTPTGAPYLVMEYLGGGSIQSLIDLQQPMRPAIAIAYLLPVARALGRAHGIGILHRDIKPANILLSSDGVSKLADFGIAGIRESTATQKAYTLAHSSPETFADADLRDERSDLYSLASTLYTLIVGRSPFASVDGTGTYQSYIARILLNPVPSSGYDIVDRFLAIAMAKDPEQRYPAAAQFVEALEAVSDSVQGLDEARPQPARQIMVEPSHSSSSALLAPPGTWPETRPETLRETGPEGEPASLRPRRRRNRLVYLAIGLVLAAVGAGFLATTWRDASPSSTEGPIVFSRHTTSIRELIVLGDDRVASAGSDGTILVWDPGQPDAEPVTLVGGAGRTGELAELGDGRIVSAGSDGNVRLWDPDQPGAEPISFSGHSGEIWEVVETGDGRIASASADETVRVWDPGQPDAEPIIFTGHELGVIEVAAMGDGRIVSGSSDGTVRVWDADRPTAEPIVFDGHTNDVIELAILRDGRIVSAGSDATVQVWDPEQPTAEPVVFTGHTNDVIELAILVDGRIASGALDSTVRIWDPNQPGAEPIVFAGHSAAVTKLTILRDGRVASGADDGSVRIWDPADPTTEPLVLSGHTNSVSELAILGDGRVISASADETVRIWDPADGNPADGNPAEGN